MNHKRVNEILEKCDEYYKSIYSVHFEILDASMLPNEHDKQINDLLSALRLCQTTLIYLKDDFERKKIKVNHRNIMVVK